MHKDIERVVFEAGEINAKVKEIGRLITEDYADKEEEIICVGILKGAVVFFTDLVRAIEHPVKFDFMSVSSYGNQAESSGEVKIRKDLDSDVKDKHIIIIEDIIDSGLTLDFLSRHFSKLGAKSVRICAFLSKPSRRKVDVAIDYCGYEVEDEFFVGYGLDYAGNYRNLPYIGILKPECYR